MARSVEPLVVGRVIGDVLEMFTPVAELMVRYGSKQIGNGCEIKPSVAAQKPHVKIRSSSSSSSSSNDLYTMIMVDPDAPSPSEPRLREWLHWIIVDIPEGTEVTEGQEIVPYMGPQPPTGIHRYVFAVFKQESTLMGKVRAPEGRANFNTRQFSAENGLGLPVAAVYFNSQKEVSVKRR